MTKSDRIRDILNYSTYLMNDKCVDIFKLKIRNLPLKITGFIIPHLCVISNSREFFFAADKTIEYAHKGHTQKSIVFYCGKATA